MEISAAVCFNQAPSSSILHAPFSDQSYLQFYHRSSFFAPSRKLCVTLPCRSSPFPVSKFSRTPFRAVVDSVCDAVVEPRMEEALMKELANLKVQIKQKKKELKARMKEEKGKLKNEMKQGKKMKKQKDVFDWIKKCAADSSSSSSESSDGECESVSMKMLRHEQVAIDNTRYNGEEGVCAPCNDGDMVVCGGLSSPASDLAYGVIQSCTQEFSRLPDSGISNTEVLLARASVGSLKTQFWCQVDARSHDSVTCGTLPSCKKASCSSIGSVNNFNSVPIANRIEVCAGGKCKKAGSEQLLSALQGQIPRAMNVEAVPCKCMGKCSSAINVRVHKEDAIPQHHSHVGLDDAHIILNHHFGRPSALPLVSSKEGLRAPSLLAIV